MPACPFGGRRGSALLVVLAVLAVFGILAVSFARVTSIESRASRTRLDGVRARFLAEAGIERAVAELRIASRRPWDGPDSPWFYRGHSGLASGHGIPVEDATVPSLAAGSPAWGRSWSGALPETHEPLGDTYTLKIVDAASKIDLNAPVDPRRTDAEQPLVRMLASLSRAIDRSDPPLAPAEAEMVLAYRKTLPGGRFSNPREILDVPGSPLSLAQYARLSEYVTTYAWADPTTIAPMDPGIVPAPGELVHGRIPTGAPRRSPRSPVDLNTAPLEVLVAVLAGVSALRVEEAIERTTPGSPAWHARGRSERTRPVSFDQAVALSLSIAARREGDPFRRWDDVQAWLSAETAKGTIDTGQAAAILANADPNTDTHRANPDEVLYRSIDKFDLVAPTTEFSFSAGGVFEIESLGRVTANGGSIQATARVRTVVEVYSVLRHSTQAQFARGSFGTYRRTEPILYQPPLAITAEEDLVVQGSVQIRDKGGSVHSNGRLKLGGSVSIDEDATAAGDYEAGSRVTVGGASGGGYSPSPIPTLDPSSFRAGADFVFAADGAVYDRSGTKLAQGSHMGFTWSNGTWSWASGPQPAGVLYFEGNVTISSRTQDVWQVTIVATGSVSIQGRPKLAPAPGMGIAILAGTDLKITGTPGSQVSGVIYAGEQIDLGGNTEYYGAFMAKGASHLDGLVTSNLVHGDVVIRFAGALEPIVLGYATSDLPTGMTGPEAPARVELGGVEYDLPSIADYDGWISLATVSTSRAFVGGEPYQDRMLARWQDGSLEADLGGGRLGLVPDRAGPVVAPIAGTGLAGHLLADGLYGEWDAVGAFEATGNLGPLAGTIAFWIKPSWDARARRSHHLLALSRTDDAGTQSFQFAHAGDWSGGWQDVVGFHFERSTLESGPERLVHSTWAPPAHRWTHVVLVYDLAAAESRDAIRVYVDGVELPGAVAAFTGSRSLAPEELARAAITPGNLLRLGERAGSDYQLPGTSPEATYDELLCRSGVADAGWVADLYAEGRYVWVARAVYDSPALSIVPVGSELLHAAWTVRAAPGGPAPALEVVDAGTVVASTADPDGVEIGRVAGGDVRYRVVLLPGPHDVPLHATPVVDDVTLAFARAPRVLVWEVLE